MNFLSPEITYFLEVVKKGSITAAASALGVAQPTISQALSRLEGSLGGKLLIRHRSGVKMTRLGEEFRRGAKRLIEQERAMTEALLTDSQFINPNFIVGCQPALASTYFVKTCQKILESLNIRDLVFHHESSSVIIDDLQNRKMDCALVAGRVKYPGLVARNLTVENVYLMSHLHGDSKTILHHPNMIGLDETFEVLSKKGIDFERRITSTDYNFLSQLAREKVGQVLLPGNFGKDDSLHSVVKEPINTVPISFVYHLEERKNPRIQSILKILVESLNGSPQESRQNGGRKST